MIHRTSRMRHNSKPCPLENVYAKRQSLYQQKIQFIVRSLGLSSVGRVGLLCEPWSRRNHRNIFRSCPGNSQFYDYPGSRACSNMVVSTHQRAPSSSHSSCRHQCHLYWVFTDNNSLSFRNPGYFTHNHSRPFSGLYFLHYYIH